MSSTFLSTIGILIGDTSSPILWTLYLADFCLRADIDDVTLSSIVVTHLEQADDIIFLSKTAAGAQRKMNAFLSWCNTNFMMINAIKSSIMIFGPTSAEPVPCFYFGEDQVLRTFSLFSYLISSLSYLLCFSYLIPIMSHMTHFLLIIINTLDSFLTHHY